MLPQKGIYRHFKGHIYKIITYARHSETLEDMVVYARVENETDVWVRPASMFCDMVVRDGVEKPRFELIEATQ